MKCFSMPSGLKEGSTVTVAEWDVCPPLCWGGKYPPKHGPKSNGSWTCCQRGPGRSGWPNKITIHNLILQHTTAISFMINCGGYLSSQILDPKTSAPRSKSWPKRESELHNWGVSHIYPAASLANDLHGVWIASADATSDMSQNADFRNNPKLSQNKGPQLPHFCISFQSWKQCPSKPQNPDLWMTGVEICARSFPLGRGELFFAGRWLVNSKHAPSRMYFLALGNLCCPVAMMDRLKRL